ncbi:tyrosine-type recombinase/integrase [Clostridium weizhouense]|uniref:Tyrosine-type recombinase/integrase n=1 Tax=Clostridium weizhouense TaxID=2859781 RepID=A0ABS7AK40_9CLOT|nr:tyrosine-type recombinase/integrase [Clostridium weizhouense]MBW6409030.1 tyrosine-type recombinase/integrase [Clostridium weizhouense]
MKRKMIEINTKSITFDRGYDEFIFYCRTRNFRPATIKFYDNTVRTIYKFIEPKTSIKDITKDTVDNFVIGCKNELDIKDITINTYLRGLKTILYYFMKLGYMEKFHIALIKYDKPVIETYTEEEIKILLKKPNKSNCTFVEFRNWTICNVLYATGMRCSNIRDLKVKEVDLYNNLLHLRTTKNRKPLAIPITKSLQPILREYLSIRNGSDEDWLFCTAYGEKMNRDSIDSSMRRYNHSRGINKTGIHRWRHTFAKQWILNNGDIIKLQKILNHSDLDMVRNYVNMFTKDLQKDFEEFNPLEFISKKSIKMRK